MPDNGDETVRRQGPPTYGKRYVGNTDKREANLNYFISSLLEASYLRNYADFNKMVGLLECIKLEQQRKNIGPYEGMKLIKNGDLWNLKRH